MLGPCLVYVVCMLVDVRYMLGAASLVCAWGVVVPETHGIKITFILKGKAHENGYIERFNALLSACRFSKFVRGRFESTFYAFPGTTHINA